LQNNTNFSFCQEKRKGAPSHERKQDNGAPQPSVTAGRAGSDTTHIQPPVVYHAETHKSMEVFTTG